MAGLLDALGGAMVDPACPIDWQHPLNNGLVADYAIIPNPGWRGGLTLRDLVRGGHNPHDGTRTGTTWAGSAGRPGGYGSLSFNGTTDKVLLSSAISLGTKNSVVFWAKIPSSGERGVAGSNSADSSSVHFQNTGANFELVYSDVSGNATAITFAESRNYASVWNQFGVSRNGTAVQFYANGVAWGAAKTLAGSAAFNIDVLGFTKSSFSFFIGNLDSLLAFNYTLTDADHAALYAETKLGNPNRFRWLGRRSYSFPSTSPPPPPASQQTFMLMGIGG